MEKVSSFQWRKGLVSRRADRGGWGLLANVWSTLHGIPVSYCCVTINLMHRNLKQQQFIIFHGSVCWLVGPLLVFPGLTHIQLRVSWARRSKMVSLTCLAVDMDCWLEALVLLCVSSGSLE